MRPSSTDVVLRHGLPIEKTFLSAQARIRGPWLFTAGILPRDTLGQPIGITLMEQAGVISGSLTQLLSPRFAGADIRWIDVFLTPGSLSECPLESVYAALLPAGVKAAHRSAEIRGLNRKEYRIEVAITAFREEQMDRERISQSDLAPQPSIVDARWAGEVLFISAHGDSLGSEASVPSRYAAALDGVLATARACGLFPRDLIQTTTYLLDTPSAEDIGEIGALRKLRLDPSAPPAGAMVQVVGLTSPSSRVAISGIGMRPNSRM